MKIRKTERYSQARRKLLQSMAAGSAAMSVKNLPEKWAKPILDTTMLPAHAQSTCQAECEVLEVLEVTGGAVRSQPTLPWPGGSGPNEIDRFFSNQDIGSCGQTISEFVGLIDDINLDVAATVSPSCGPVTLVATLDGATNMFSLNNGNNQVVAPDPVTGAVAFSSLNVGFDPFDFVIESSTIATAVLDLRIQGAATSECNIDIAFTERLICTAVNCLLHGSLVMMADGRLQRVEELAVGDKVLSVSASLAGFEHTVVTKVKTNHLRESFYSVNGNLRITGDHPVLTLRDGSWAWVRVDELLIGDVIRSTESSVVVAQLTKHNVPAMTVYIETSSGSFVARAGDASYVIKSTYAAAHAQLEPQQKRRRQAAA